MIGSFRPFFLLGIIRRDPDESTKCKTALPGSPRSEPLRDVAFCHNSSGFLAAPYAR